MGAAESGRPDEIREATGNALHLQTHEFRCPQFLFNIRGHAPGPPPRTTGCHRFLNDTGEWRERICADAHDLVFSIQES